MPQAVNDGGPGGRWRSKRSAPTGDGDPASLQVAVRTPPTRGLNLPLGPRGETRSAPLRVSPARPKEEVLPRSHYRLREGSVLRAL